MSRTRIPLTAWVRQLDRMKIRLETRRGELEAEIYEGLTWRHSPVGALEDRFEHYGYLWGEIDKLVHVLEAARRH